MEQIVIDDHVYLIGKAADVFREMAYIVVFSQYGIGWRHRVDEYGFDFN